MDNERIQAEIRALKSLLADTDYVGIKIGEGAAKHSDYAEICDKRQSWRDRINELEAMLTDEEEV